VGPRRGVVTTPRVLFAQRTGLLYLKVFMPDFAEDSLRVGCVLDATRSNPGSYPDAATAVLAAVPRSAVHTALRTPHSSQPPQFCHSLAPGSSMQLTSDLLPIRLLLAAHTEDCRISPAPRRSLYQPCSSSSLLFPPAHVASLC